MKCPICFETDVKRGIYCQCRADICLSCQSKLDICPFCRSKYPNVLERIFTLGCSSDVLDTYLKAFRTAFEDEKHLEKKAQTIIFIIRCTGYSTQFFELHISSLIGDDSKLYVKVMRSIEEDWVDSFHQGENTFEVIGDFLEHFHHSAEKFEELLEYFINKGKTLEKEAAKIYQKSIIRGTKSQKNQKTRYKPIKNCRNFRKLRQ